MIQKCTICDTDTPKVYLKTLKRHSKDNKGVPRTWNRNVYVDASGRQWNCNECPDCKYGSKQIL